MTENAPAMLGSELECDNFDNGPKIVDVLSGDAGANEFYRGIAEAKSITEQVIYFKRSVQILRCDVVTYFICSFIFKYS